MDEKHRPDEEGHEDEPEKHEECSDDDGQDGPEDKKAPVGEFVPGGAVARGFVGLHF